MSIRYFIYARKSSESEDRQMASIDDQISEMKRQAEESGFAIVDVIFESKSAKEPGRPMFNEMLLRIHRKEAQGILCWSLNRLARNPVDGGQISWLLQQNIIYHIKTHSRDYWPTDNVLMMQVEFGMANQFVKDLSVDVKRGMKSKAERGWYPISRLPLGYVHNRDIRKSDGPEIVKDLKTYPLVKKLWTLMLSGNYSVAEITREAERIGLRNHLGNPYTKQAFWGMFNNEFYCGYFQWNADGGERKRHRGKHLPMVSEKEYQKVQHILKQRFNSYPKRGVLKFTYSGLIGCGECGRSITAERVYRAVCPSCKHRFSIKHRTVCNKCGADLKDYPTFNTLDRSYYQCTKYQTNCSQGSIQPDELENQVLNFLAKISIDQEIYDWLITCLQEFQLEKETEVNEEIVVLRKRLTELNKRISQLVRLRADGEISSDEMIAVKQSTLKEIEGVEQSMSHQNPKCIDWLKVTAEKLNLAIYASETFRDADDALRRALLTSLLSNLSLKDKKLYSTTVPAISVANECASVYEVLKRTSEPAKSVPTYSELGFSDPLRKVLCAQLNALRICGIDILEKEKRVHLKSVHSKRGTNMSVVQSA